MKKRKNNFLTLMIVEILELKVNKIFELII